MSKIIFSLFLLSFCFTSAITTAQTTSVPAKNAGKSNASVITGAWRSVDGTEFAMMYDGFFSAVAQDSTGRWVATHVGTYTIDHANTLTLKVLHSSFPERVGSLHTVEYDIKGNNLTIKWFKKLVDAKQGDITARMPKNEQTQYTRANR